VRTVQCNGCALHSARRWQSQPLLMCICYVVVTAAAATTTTTTTTIIVKSPHDIAPKGSYTCRLRATAMLFLLTDELGATRPLIQDCMITDQLL
jgi:hypothetical protein